MIAASLVEPARFAELFDRHYPAILRYLRRRVAHQLADDLAADTFVLAFRQRRRYRAQHPDAAAAGRRVAPAVADLPAEEREVLLLVAWTDLDDAVIARALGVPAGTVRSRLHRARQRLRRQFGWAAAEQSEELQPIPPGGPIRHERA